MKMEWSLKVGIWLGVGMGAILFALPVLALAGMLHYLAEDLSELIRLLVFVQFLVNITLVTGVTLTLATLRELLQSNGKRQQN